MYQHSPATTGCSMRLNWIQKIIERRTGKLRRELEVLISSREKGFTRMQIAHARVKDIKLCRSSVLRLFGYNSHQPIQ